MKFRASVLLTIAAIGLISVSSCTKNYSCHCDIIYSGYPGLPDSTTTEYGITDTKSGAKSKCSAQSGTYNNNGIQTVETCYLY